MGINFEEQKMSNYNPFTLEGKTILVTGASSGIGKATAIECSKMGAKLVITGRNAERLQQTFDALEGEGHQQIIAELTTPEEVKEFVGKVLPINGVALCAGKNTMQPFLFCTRDKFDDTFNTNFFAPVELLRLLVKNKKLAKGGSVVTIVSVAGTPGGRFTSANDIYGSGKAALWSAMKYAALELAPKGIRVNTVNPAMVRTPLLCSGAVSDEQLDQALQHYPLRRYGEPEDIAHGIIYLLSDASSWVTGHSLVIDGGVTI